MWYVLNYVPPRGVKRSSLAARIAAFSNELEFFAPTFIEISSEAGSVEKREKPLLYHYIFVKGPENIIKDLCRKEEGFSFVLNRAGATRHVTVTDDTLEQFRIIAHYYAGKLPCYPLEGINLEEGDKVQIISGPCAGLSGTYISRKGGKSGNILVAVDGSMAVIVYDIKAEYVRVLEFAHDSKRLYDQLDAYVAKLTPLLNSPSAPSISEIAAANVFSSRLCNVKVDNPKIEAKLAILLYAAFSILSDEENAKRALSRYSKLDTNITSSKTKTLCNQIIEKFSEK